MVSGANRLVAVNSDLKREVISHHATSGYLPCTRSLCPTMSLCVCVIARRCVCCLEVKKGEGPPVVGVLAVLPLTAKYSEYIQR